MKSEKQKYIVKTTLNQKQTEQYTTEKPRALGRAFIKFEDAYFNVDVMEELTIDVNDLVSSMVKHAGTYGWWASLNATSKRILRKLKKDKDKERNNLDTEARASLKAQEIKVTEEAVRAWLNSDPRINSTDDEITTLEDLVEYTDAILKSLEHKRDMLKEINRAQLKEYYSVKN